MPTHTKFKSVQQYGDALPSDQLETNLYTFFTWGMLEIGAFSNVNVPTSGFFGGDQSRLRCVEDPYYTKGQVWEGFRQDWVWESGIEYSYQPIRVSGVWVNSGFKPLSGVGPYAHHVNYPLGRIVFDTAINPSSVVQCSFSYRNVHFETGDCPWWRQVQLNSQRVDNPHFLQYASGQWSILGQNRMQLPAVVIETVPTSIRNPFEIGSNVQTVKQDVLFHIVSETPWDRKQLSDIITAQEEKRLNGFDKNLMFDNNVFPLDYRGSPAASGKMYPDLVKPTGDGGCMWRQIRFKEMRTQEQRALAPLYYTTVRAKIEFEYP